MKTILVGPRTCKVCGEILPKYKLDRYTDEHCSYECLIVEEGHHESFACGAAIVFGMIALGTWAAERAEVHRTERRLYTGPEDTLLLAM